MPSSFIDIMMLRPAVRTSVIAACSSGSSTSTTPPRLAPRLSQPIAEIAHQFVKLLQPAQIFVLIVLGELDEQHGVRIAVHELLERRAEHRDLARQLDHGAVDQFDRDRARACTMCWAASIAS